MSKCVRANFSTPAESGWLEPLTDRRADGVDKLRLKAIVHEIALPHPRDAVVLGRQAPVGYVAFHRALELLVATPYDPIEIEDETIGNILVRQALLRRIPRDCLIDFTLRRIKPLMGVDDMLSLELRTEIAVTEGGGDGGQS
ncbi:hypothetical protein [Methylomagnum sp.]